MVCALTTRWQPFSETVKSYRMAEIETVSMMVRCGMEDEGSGKTLLAQ